MFRINYIKDSKGVRYLESVIVDNPFPTAQISDNEGIRILESTKYGLYPVDESPVKRRKKGKVLVNVDEITFPIEMFERYEDFITDEELNQPMGAIFSVTTSSLQRLVDYINGGKPNDENLVWSQPFPYNTTLNGTVIELPLMPAFGLDSETGVFETKAFVNYITSLTVDGFMEQKGWKDWKYPTNIFEMTRYNDLYDSERLFLGIVNLERYILDERFIGYEPDSSQFCWLHGVSGNYGVLLVDDSDLQYIKEWLYSLTIESYDYI